MTMPYFRTMAVALLAAGAASPYVRSGAVKGHTPLVRGDAAGVQFLVNLTRGGNVSGTDAEIMAALQAAATTWSSISGTTIHFNTLQTTGKVADSSDSQNVIAFQNSSTTGSVVQDALAITFTFATPDGQLTDSDIVFNSDIKTVEFSTAPSATKTDLQSVATHEMGHALGASHSGVYGATMWYSIGPNQTGQRALSEDDLAFAREAYVSPGGPTYGTITGHLIAAAGGLLHAGLVTAVDPVTGVVVGGMSTITTGMYTFQVPVGNYLIYAEPVGGELTPSVFALGAKQVSTNFQAGMYIVNGSPVTVKVTAGSVNTADITPPSGTSALGVVYGDVNYAGYFAADRQMVPSGGSVDIQIAGPGLDMLTEQDIQVLGPATVQPGSFFVEGSPLKVSATLSYPLILFTLNVPARKTIALASLFMSHGVNSTAFTGALILEPARPLFDASSLVNAFTFTGGGISPGEDISLFGVALGPGADAANTPDVRGAYSTTLGGVTVTFDGQPAPLFYVSQAQINMQVPFEVLGKTTTKMVVTYKDTQSDVIAIPVAATAPGLFPVAVNNDDGLLNSLQSPAKSGSYIILYGTGQGAVTPTIGTGQPAPGSTGLAYAGATTVSIDGRSATPYFSGMAPGFVGLWQISVQIPPGIVSGDKAVSVTVNGAATSAIDVWVK